MDEGHRRMFYKRGTFVKRAELSSTESRFLFFILGHAFADQNLVFASKDWGRCWREAVKRWRL